MIEQVTGQEIIVLHSDFILTTERSVDRYSTLPNVGQQLDFVSIVQLPVLDLYRLRISSFLDGFESVSASFVRAVPGAMSRDPSRSGGENSVKRETTGVGGAQKLCKALISTDYISKAMRGWGDEMVSGTLGPSLCLLIRSPNNSSFWNCGPRSFRTRASE